MSVPQTNSSELRANYDDLLGKYIAGKITEDEYFDRLLADREAAITAALEQLKSELRDYYDTVPDANYFDVIGYIAGFQYRPHPTAKKGKEDG